MKKKSKKKKVSRPLTQSLHDLIEGAFTRQKKRYSSDEKKYRFHEFLTVDMRNIMEQLQ